MLTKPTGSGSELTPTETQFPRHRNRILGTPGSTNQDKFRLIIPSYRSVGPSNRIRWSKAPKRRKPIRHSNSPIDSLPNHWRAPFWILASEHVTSHHPITEINVVHLPKAYFSWKIGECNSKVLHPKIQYCSWSLCDTGYLRRHHCPSSSHSSSHRDTSLHLATIFHQPTLPETAYPNKKGSSLLTLEGRLTA